MKVVSKNDICLEGIIPDGWRVEVDDSYGVIIVAIDKLGVVRGFVTVSEKSRSFDFGINPLTKELRNEYKYKGRGWKVELYSDAVKSLTSALGWSGEN